VTADEFRKINEMATRIWNIRIRRAIDGKRGDTGTSTLQELSMHKLSASTIRQYKKTAERYQIQKLADILRKKTGKGHPHTFKTKSDLRNTYAAVAHTTAHKISKINPNSDYNTALGIIKEAAEDLTFFSEQYRQEYKPTPRHAKPIGKLIALEKKNMGWRDELQHAMRNSKHLAAFLVSRASGCRPEELSNGIRVEKAEDGNGYLLHIVTAKEKQNNKKMGSRVRIIRSTMPDLEGLAGSTIQADKGSFSRMFRQYAVAAVGVDISPYSLRYAVAADAKAAGASDVERAELLGHSDDETARRYTIGMNTKGRRDKPAQVELARVQIRQIRLDNQRNIPHSPTPTPPVAPGM